MKGLAVIVGGLVLTTLGQASPKPVTWTEVRSAIGKTICVRTHEDQGKEYRAVMEGGDREACGLPDAATPIERAVEAAFRDAGALLVSLALGNRILPRLEGVPRERWDEIAHESLLAHDDYLRILVPRIEKALVAEGLNCEGCPSFAPRPIRRITWSELAPYLGAHVWPDPVRPEVGPDGKPTGDRAYSFHVCIGLNGISEMKDPDPALVRAGFFLVMSAPAVKERAGEIFGFVRREPALLAIQDDEGQTRYLRERVPAEVVKDPEVRRGICETLERYSRDLGVEVVDCRPAEAG